jgi:hypothetical protein
MQNLIDGMVTPDALPDCIYADTFSVVLRKPVFIDGHYRNFILDAWVLDSWVDSDGIFIEMCIGFGEAFVLNWGKDIGSMKPQTVKARKV